MRTITRLFTAVTLLIALAWIYQVSFLRTGDKERVLALIEEKKRVDSGRSFSSTSQKRQGVHKEIWFAEEEGNRLHYRVDSAASLLTFAPMGNKVDVVEHLQDLTLWMQERLERGPDAQQVRSLKADEGVYRMAFQEFAAQRVQVALFRLPGTELPRTIDPRSAFLRGNAESFYFSLSGNQPRFEAKQFTAALAERP